jgi:hypothetical protein
LREADGGCRQFVYHGVPTDMVGTTPYPLFALRDLDPASYDKAIAKYTGRKAALDAVVPGLGVRLNDTVHCAPIHPWLILQARLAEGLDPLPVTQTVFSGDFYRIPIEAIMVNPAVWYEGKAVWINGAPGQDVALAPPADEFSTFRADGYREFTQVPDDYRPRLRELLAMGERPLMFLKIPHVLVAGPIDVSDAKIVNWNQPPGWTTAAGG